MWPELVEVETPSLAARLAALRVGSYDLALKWLNATDSEKLAVEDFSACLEYLMPLLKDPVLQLVRSNALDDEDYESAKKSLERIKEEPESLSAATRCLIIGSFEQTLETLHADLLEEFHRRLSSPPSL